MNGYSLNITSDAPEFARQVAAHTIDDPNHKPSVEVDKIAKWLKGNVTSTLFTRIRYGLAAKKALKQGYSGDIYIDSNIVSDDGLSYAIWLAVTTSTFQRLLHK